VRNVLYNKILLCARGKSAFSLISRQAPEGGLAGMFFSILLQRPPLRPGLDLPPARRGDPGPPIPGPFR